jgi:pilus assembly protein CpaF
VSLAARLHHAIVEDPSIELAEPTLRSLALNLAPLSARAAVDDAVAEVLARVRGLGALERWLADPEVTEVMINAGRDIWVERRGRLERVGDIDSAETERIIERILAPLGVRVDRTAPLGDARLADGSRVHVALPPVAIDGPTLTLRRFGTHGLGLAAFADPRVVPFLRDLVTERRNILVSGGTGSGKTTLLNALTASVPSHERIVTIEDAAELRLRTSHVVRLESRPANADGVAEIPIRALLRAALRMRPDRIIVGEVRGAEALDMVHAMNTGHDGSLSTCHANSPTDALARLETMMLYGQSNLPLEAARSQLRSALDVIIQVARASGGRRHIVDIVKVNADGVRSIDDDQRVIGHS